MKRAILALLFVIAIAAVSTNIYSQGKKERAIDPVCGLTVDKNPELSATYKGDTFYFCSNRDLNVFKQNPEKYPKKK